MTLTAFGLTDVGRKRRHNEDAYLLDAERGLFVVADGMGGHAAGEVASRITVESIQEFIAGTEDEHENTWPFGFNNRYSLEGNRLTTSVEKANEKVMRAVQNRPELKGMGTTVVAALFDANHATLVHVGDSRAYMLRRGELKRLTDDHSWVQEQVNAGILSEDEAKSHPLKNVVTRALGGAAHVAVDLIEVPTIVGDRFLLCSDGLTGMVSDEEIHRHLNEDPTLDVAVHALIDLANERGGVDNITAIVVEVTGEGSAANLVDTNPGVEALGEQTAVGRLTPPAPALRPETTEVTAPMPIPPDVLSEAETGPLAVMLGTTPPAHEDTAGTGPASGVADVGSPAPPSVIDATDAADAPSAQADTTPTATPDSAPATATATAAIADAPSVEPPAEALEPPAVGPDPETKPTV